MKHTTNPQTSKRANRTVPGDAAHPKPGSEDKKSGQQKPGFLSFRSLLLSLLLLGFLGILRQVKSYQNFFAETIDDAYEKITLIRELDDYKSVKTRKEMRWGYSYYWVVVMKEYLKQQPEAVVLVPPNSYIETINPKQILPEPAVGYYYSGLKTAWSTSDYAYKCTHYYKPDKEEGPAVIPISSRAQIDSLRQLYKGYTYY